MNLEQRIKEIIKDIPDFPKKGIVFKDITPILLHPELSKAVGNALAEHAKSLNIEAVCGIESRGFIYGSIIAQALDVPFILVRKQGKLPGDTIAYSYSLEYGTATIEVHSGDIPKGAKVLIHDDLLATGGTARAAGELVKRAGGEVAGYSFLVNLTFLNGKERLTSLTPNIFSLTNY